MRQSRINPIWKLSQESTQIFIIRRIFYFFPIDQLNFLRYGWRYA